MHAVLRCLLAALLSVCAAAFCQGQDSVATAHAAADTLPPPNLFKGKRVAIYISKRNLNFSEEYYRMLSHYIQVGDTIGLSDEDIRLGVVIKLGNDLARIFKTKMQADTAFFINAMGEFGNLFIKNYQNKRLNFAAIGPQLPPSTDYILIIDGLLLTGESRESVYPVSNVIATERRYARLVKIDGRLYDVRNRHMAAGLQQTYDQDTTRHQTFFYRPETEKYPALQFLSRVMNSYYYNLFKLARKPTP
jgi:hypothetical protein